ncbi:nitroreductase domain protein [Streptococcus pyogenes GA06023]|nr:nitroreductase domain protein [Streptococcus pyogenes GA06023]
MDQTIHHQIQQALHFRTAVRVYKEEKISDEDLALILDAAWLSPSSVGLEGWRFVVLDNKPISPLPGEPSINWKQLVTLFF